MTKKSLVNLTKSELERLNRFYVSARFRDGGTRNDG